MFKDNGRMKGEENKERASVKQRSVFCPKCEKLTILKATFGRHTCSNCAYEFTSGNTATG